MFITAVCVIFLKKLKTYIRTTICVSSTVKRERFFAHVYFSNETVSQTTVSTGPMKMVRLEHETMNVMNVCQRNVALLSTCSRHFLGFRKLGVIADIATSERWRP